MARQYKQQLENAQQFVGKLMTCLPVNLAVVVLAAMAMVQFQEKFQFYFYQYMHMFAVTFAMWIVLENYKWKQLFKELIKSVGQVEITSQVVATRANMRERRSCLQFNAAWTGCSLASSYRMWQLGLNRSPLPPANTVNPFGMQLATFDALIAENEFPSYQREFHSMDYSMSVLKEQYEIQLARESSEKWKREAVEHLPIFSAESRREIQQYLPLLRN